MSINIEGLDKAAVLAALYNASMPLGLGILHFDPTPMTVDEAREIFEASRDKYFDYVKGRVLKTDLSTDEVYPDGFDRDNGAGAAARAIAALR